MSKPSTAIGVAGLVAVLAALASTSTALAQAGSTGGTIGKQGKSVSGREDAVQTHQFPPRRKAISENSNAKAHKAVACGNVAGLWTSNYSGLFGEDDTRISADGTYRHKTGLVAGSWTCSAGVFAFSATNGAREQVTLSPDGNRLVKPTGEVWLRR